MLWQEISLSFYIKAFGYFYRKIQSTCHYFYLMLLTDIFNHLYMFLVYFSLCFLIKSGSLFLSGDQIYSAVRIALICSTAKIHWRKTGKALF